MTATQARPARRVPAGTFTPPKPFVMQRGRDRDSPHWDWRNPYDNPSGKRPVEDLPHTYAGAYNPDNYPVFEAEFRTRLFQPDIIECMEDQYANWSKMSETEQIEAQLDWTWDCRAPCFGGSMSLYEDTLHREARRLQKLIKR